MTVNGELNKADRCHSNAAPSGAATQAESAVLGMKLPQVQHNGKGLCCVRIE